MPAFYKDSYSFNDNNLFSLSICNVGRQKCDAHHQWGPGVRDHYLIHYVVSGKGAYKVDNKTYNLGPGDAFLVYPNKQVHYYADDTDPWEYAWVGFIGTDAPSVLKATPFISGQPVVHIKKQNESILKYMDLIYNARGTDFVHSVEMTGYLYLLFSAFMQEEEKVVRLSQSENYVMISMDYISANYSQPLSVEDIADHVGVSRSHLYRSFQEVIGKSPKEFLTEYRINQACYLLTHTSLSMKSIATAVGYENSLYFSKAFHKHMGMPPSEYSKSDISSAQKDVL